MREILRILSFDDTRHKRAIDEAVATGDRQALKKVEARMEEAYNAYTVAYNAGRQAMELMLQYLPEGSTVEEVRASIPDGDREEFERFVAA
jgi:hypothetical protein